MRIPKPSKLGLFQLLVASLLVALYWSPGEAHHGPMLLFKGGKHHGGGNGGAAMILAAGILIKLLSQLGKHGHSMGHSMGHRGYPMGSNGMGYSFESHDAHLQDYGYEPQEYVWPQH